MEGWCARNQKAIRQTVKGEFVIYKVPIDQHAGFFRVIFGIIPAFH
jgi:hypothetical protein